jgi:hypothetical protein
MELAGLEPATSWVRFGRGSSPCVVVARQLRWLGRFWGDPSATDSGVSSLLLDQVLTGWAAAFGLIGVTAGALLGVVTESIRRDQVFVRRVQIARRPKGLITGLFDPVAFELALGSIHSHEIAAGAMFRYPSVWHYRI